MKKKVSFKLIESHGLPVCRERGTLVQGFLHSKECRNFNCDDIESLGNKQFLERWDELERIAEREKWIDEMFYW